MYIYTWPLVSRQIQSTTAFDRPQIASCSTTYWKKNHDQSQRWFFRSGSIVMQHASILRRLHVPATTSRPPKMATLTFIHAHNFLQTGYRSLCMAFNINRKKNCRRLLVLYDKTGSGATPATDPSYLFPNDATLTRLAWRIILLSWMSYRRKRGLQNVQGVRHQSCAI